MPEIESIDWDERFKRHKKYQQDLWRNSTEKPDLMETMEEYRDWLLLLPDHMREETLQRENMGADALRREHSMKLQKLRERLRNACTPRDSDEFSAS